MIGDAMQFKEGLAEWSWSAILAGAGSHLERYEADFRAAELLKGDTLSFSFRVWASSGQPPHEEEAETFDAWVAEQEALFDGLVGAQQTISVSTVGFVGAAGASLKILLIRRNWPASLMSTRSSMCCCVSCPFESASKWTPT
jgi:hypothetical protein